LSIRHNQIRLVLLIGLFVSLGATAGTPTPPPPKEATLTCQVSPEVKQGETGIISCVGFTHNAEVTVIFYRPDGSTSQHVGKADGDGNFDGTFTVDLDRPAGEWTLVLIDGPSGRTIEIPFTVIPSLIETPVTPTVAPAPTSTPTSASTPTPTLTPAPEASPTLIPFLFSRLPWWFWLLTALAIFGTLSTAFIFFVSTMIRIRRSRIGPPLPPPSPPPPPEEDQEPPAVPPPAPPAPPEPLKAEGDTYPSLVQEKANWHREQAARLSEMAKQKFAGCRWYHFMLCSCIAEGRAYTNEMAYHLGQASELQFPWNPRY